MVSAPHSFHKVFSCRASNVVMTRWPFADPPLWCQLVRQLRRKNRITNLWLRSNYRQLPLPISVLICRLFSNQMLASRVVEVRATFFLASLARRSTRWFQARVAGIEMYPSEPWQQISRKMPAISPGQWEKKPRTRAKVSQSPSTPGSYFWSSFALDWAAICNSLFLAMPLRTLAKALREATRFTSWRAQFQVWDNGMEFYRGQHSACRLHWLAFSGASLHKSTTG